MDKEISENSNADLIRKIYRYYAESENVFTEKNKLIDEKIMKVFRKYYSGSVQSMEAFRDEIFGIAMEVQEEYFCEGFKCGRELEKL